MSDYISIRKACLVHASMAGMPTNVARKLGYKNVTGNVNSHVGAEEKAKARVAEAKKKLDTVQAKIDDYTNSMYNAVSQVRSLNPIKRAEGFIGLINSITGRKDFMNLKDEYTKAANEYSDAERRLMDIQHTLSSYRMDKEYAEATKKMTNSYNRDAKKAHEDFVNESAKMNEEFNNYVKKSNADFKKRTESAKKEADRWYQNEVNRMRDTTNGGSTAGMPSYAKKRKK